MLDVSTGNCMLGILTYTGPAPYADYTEAQDVMVQRLPQLVSHFASNAANEGETMRLDVADSLTCPGL